MRGAFLLIPLALALVAAALLAGRPFVAFATSGSMSPAIEVGDAFLVDPFERAPQIGDVVVYAPVASAHALAVHRVVAGSPAGFVTKGDANPVTDQDAGEPLVTRERIRGVVLAGSDGEPLALDGVALPLLRARLAAFAALDAIGASAWPKGAVAAVAGAATLVLAMRPRQVMRAAARPRASGLLPRGLLGKHVAIALVATCLAATALATDRAASDVTLSLVVADTPPLGQTRSTTPGGVVPRDVEVAAFALAPTIVVVETREGATASVRDAILAPRETLRVTVAIEAGTAVGLEEHVVRVTRYPAVLPPSATLALHHAAPGLPVLLVGIALSAGTWIWWRSLALDDVPLSALLGRVARGRRAA